MISIVMPVYNEGHSICANVRVVRDLLTERGIECSFVLVDDGSTDNTWDELCRLNESIPDVLVLSFSRNFGKEAAVCAGLASAKGDACVVMDSDLQHPPELIPEMVRLWEREGYDIVEGVKSSRGTEGRAHGLVARLFYGTFAKMSGIDIGHASDFKLLDRKAVEAWRLLDERETFFRGMAGWIGFRRCQVPFEVRDRVHGQSKWSLGGLVKLAGGALSSYSAMPLYIVMYVGVIFDVLAAGMLVQTLFMKVTGHASSGFTTVILLQLITSGLLLTAVGVNGVYLSRVYDETKRRPRYLISKRRGEEFVVDA